MKGRSISIASLTIAIVLVLLLAVSCIPSPWPDRETSFWSPFWFPGGFLSLAIYFLPIIIAAARRKKKILGIVLLNVLAGWTLVGWIIALIWAFRPD